MSAGTVKQSTRLRKCECTVCGCIVRMSRAAMARAGVPSCGCGAGPFLVVDLEDACAVLPPEQLHTHPGFVDMAELEHRRAIREARGATGNRLHCGGCQAFIPATNHACSCGFQNDIRGRRNVGHWAEGASYCREYQADQVRRGAEMPF